MPLIPGFGKHRQANLCELEASVVCIIPISMIICCIFIKSLKIYLYFLFIFRVGQRGAGLSATIARSEHEISEIIDGLSEQEVRKLIHANSLVI